MNEDAIKRALFELKKQRARNEGKTCEQCAEKATWAIFVRWGRAGIFFDHYACDTHKDSLAAAREESLRESEHDVGVPFLAVIEKHIEPLAESPAPP